MKLKSTPILSSTILRVIPIVTFILLGLTACKKTDDYYQKLRLEPELYNLKGYDLIYGLGDTLNMYGRFLSDDLVVKIGDAEAMIIEKTNAGKSAQNIYNDDSIQVVKLKVAPNMGIGPNRPISITAGGITIKAPSIEIVTDRNGSVLKNGLTVQKIANYPIGYLPVYCHSGTGNMYFINTNTPALMRINNAGTGTALSFNAATFKDNDGTLFSVTRFNGFGIDPDERYLYLSVYEQAKTGTQWHYYRLCRFDLLNNSFMVLNKTPYSVSKNVNTEAAAKPFEGNIQTVKMFSATGIYPSKAGKVYFNMGNRAITLLETSGNYTYRFKNTLSITPADPAPQIYDEATANYRNADYLKGILPGKEAPYQNISALDPEKDFVYIKTDQYQLVNNDLLNTLKIQQYDLSKQIAGNLLNKVFVPSALNKPYSVGSFNILNYSGGDNGNFGLMPLQDGQLVVLKYQDIASNATFKKYNLPQWAVVDFAKEQGQFYAPGSFDRKTYVMSSTGDVLLNYDAQGMLYMTANEQSTIIKTIYK